MTESDAQVWLDLETISVAAEDYDAPKILENNARYTKLLEARLSDNSYVNRPIQTHNPAQKTKDVQAVLIKNVSSECQVTEWDIYDAHQIENHNDDSG
ncbi:WD repeat-containing protein 78 [Coelomomyces lativittatus]|nr:WD repeat-containing protein 78 [Coelomomyces lativittatus]